MNIKYFGCSHSIIFGNDEINIDNKKYKFIDCHQDSVSLKGLSKKSSKTNYKLKIIDELKNNNNNNDIYILKIGQVDLEFGFYYKINSDGINIDINLFIDELIKIYKNFLMEINYLNSMLHT